MLGFLTVLGAIALPGAAQAHTEMVSSTPAAGDTLSEAPRQMRLRFNEDLEKDFANLTVAIGASKSLTLRPTVNGEVVTATVPQAYRAMAERGSRKWRLAYRVVSGDGHPVTGSFTFTVKRQSPPAVMPSATPTDDAAAESGAQADTAPGGETSVSAQGPTSGPGASEWVPTAVIGMIAIACSGVVMARVARGRREDKRG